MIGAYKSDYVRSGYNVRNFGTDGVVKISTD